METVYKPTKRSDAMNSKEPTYAELLAEVQRLRERLIRAYDWTERMLDRNDSAMMFYTEYVCGGEEE